VLKSIKKRQPLHTTSAVSAIEPGTHTAAEQTYALLFEVTPFILPEIGPVRLWTLSLPVIAAVHGSQDSDISRGVIFWHRSFSSVVGRSLTFFKQNLLLIGYGIPKYLS
jgi:hypothetical protein